MASADNVPRQILYYGSEDSHPPRLNLNAGDWSARLVEGQLWNLLWRGREVAQRIYVAVRDRQWGTIVPRVSLQEVATTAAGWRAEFVVRHCELPIDFTWRGVIETQDNELTFSMDGAAHAEFWMSRIGFCVTNVRKSRPKSCCF